MRNWKLFGKIGAIALTALGLALVPGDFNVPGVGTVEAFAAEGDVTVSAIADATYSGSVIKPTAGASGDFTVKVENKSATDVDVSSEVTVTYPDTRDNAYIDVYENNTVHIEGEGTLSDGTEWGIDKDVLFKIVQKNISSATVTVLPAEFTGGAPELAVTVVDGTKTLKLDNDYTVRIADAVKTAKYVADTYAAGVVVTGTGNYGGTANGSLTINASADAPDVELSAETAEYNAGKNVAPKITFFLNGVKLDDSLFVCTWKKGSGAATSTITDTGEYKLVVSEAGSNDNFDDTKLNKIDKTFTVTGKDLSEVTVEGFTSLTWLTNTNGTEFDDLKVYLDGKELDDNDIKITYKNNKSAGEATLTIDPANTTYGKAYTGQYEEKFTLVAPDLSRYGTLKLKEDSVAYTGNVNKVDVESLTLRGSGLPDLTLEGDDILSAATISYKSTAENTITDAGTITVTASGKAGTAYTGTADAKYTIEPAEIDEFAVWNPSKIVDQNYTGKEVEPEVGLKAKTGGATVATTDYTLKYENNTDAGTATVTATGKNNLTGTKTIEFTIKPANLPAVTIKAIDDQVYTGSAVTPKDLTVLVTATSKALVEDKDYTLSYKNNTQIGTGTVVISGAGNYSSKSEKTVTFKIVEADLEKVASATAEAQVYTGSAIEPVKVIQTADKKELTKGTDYTIEYENNTEVGTASFIVTGKGNYTGTLKGEFTISNDFSEATIAAIAAQTYTGKALTPAVTVKVGTTTLKANTDYTVAYKNNTNAGIATVTVTPAGSYLGAAKTATFKINKASVKAKITKITGKNAVGAGKAVTLKATLSPAKSNANQNVNTTVKWTSNKTAIAKVSNKGVVTGVTAGTAKITATAADGSKKTYNVKVYGIASKNLKQTVKAGKSKNVAANDTVNKATSSNTKVATATVKGKKVVIKGVKKGTAKITVTTKNGGKNVITVTVK